MVRLLRALTRVCRSVVSEFDLVQKVSTRNKGDAVDMYVVLQTTWNGPVATRLCEMLLACSSGRGNLLVAQGGAYVIRLAEAARKARAAAWAAAGTWGPKDEQNTVTPRQQ